MGRDGMGKGRGRVVWELSPEADWDYVVSSRGSSTPRGGGDPNKSVALRCTSTLRTVLVDSAMLNLHSIRKVYV